LRRAEGGAKNFGVFRVKKITILRQKIIFFPIAKGGANIFGVFLDFCVYLFIYLRECMMHGLWLEVIHKTLNRK
jgi:hypothetical protein